MNNDSETVREVCANCEVFDAYERFKAAKDAEIARLKAALKPVMEIDMSDETKFTQTQVTLAVSDAQRIMKEFTNGESHN